MPNSWVAVDAGIDPQAWARLLRRAYRRTESGRDGGSKIIRPVVAESWKRSEQAAVEREGRAPLMVEEAEARRTLEHHPLRPLLPVLEDCLLEFAGYARQVVAVANEDGLIMWTAGHPRTLREANRIHLVPGALWSETAAGTNALGTCLALDHPVQIFSAEHFKHSLHGWSSAAAPIHDSDRGDIVGGVHLAGPLKAAHPHGFSLVASVAQIVESRLEHEAGERDARLKIEYLERVLEGCERDSAVVNSSGEVLLSTPPGWLGHRLRLSPRGVPLPPPTEEVTVEPFAAGEGFLVLRCPPGSVSLGRAVLRLRGLGRNRLCGVLGSRELEFTPRHSEILVILARHPEGLYEQELAAALHGPEARISAVTIRAEISRLRKLLGPVVCTQPYRLAADVCADFLEVEMLVERGEAQQAARWYRGPLLPESTAPGVTEARERLDRACARRSAATSSVLH